MKKIITACAVLSIAFIFQSCGAGGNNNDYATCGDAGMAIKYCMNAIEGAGTYDDAYAAKLVTACENMHDLGCVECIFNNTCDVPGGKTQADICYELGQCGEFVVE